MRPLIGITSYFVSGEELENFQERPRGATGQDMAMSTIDYARGVEKGGGIPFNIPVINEEDYIKKL